MAQFIVILKDLYESRGEHHKYGLSAEAICPTLVAAEKAIVAAKRDVITSHWEIIDGYVDEQLQAEWLGGDPVPVSDEDFEALWVKSGLAENYEFIILELNP